MHLIFLSILQGKGVNWVPREYRRIKYSDRKKLEKLFKNGKEHIQIADIIGCSREAIYQEEKRGWDVNNKEYSADLAQQRVGITIKAVMALNKKENEKLLKKQRKEKE